MTGRIHWMDAVKAICMISVYLLHSEVYYGTGGTSYGYILEPFYVNAFFFVSGYSFFKKHTANNKLVYIDNLRGIKSDLANLFYRLVIPTLLFSSLIYLPKMFFHNRDVSLERYLFDVWGGISYWFTSALVVSQIIMLFLLLFRFRYIWMYVFATFALFGLGLYLKNEQYGNDITVHFPWFYKTGLVYTFIMALGGTYYLYEKTIDKLMKQGWIAAGVIYAGIIISTWETHSVKIGGLDGDFNILGFIAMICSTILLVMITKKNRHTGWLEFIGKSSIVFYFFSGVMPAACGAIINRIELEKNFIFTIIVAVISIAISYVIAKIIEGYMPFLKDLRKLKKQ